MSSDGSSNGENGWLIVGLGNPGDEYQNTRHNIGFALVDYLAGRAEVRIRRKECEALIGSAVLEGKRVELVKPQTFMNLSGNAVACLLKKPPRAIERLIVISDDLALPFGRLRIRAKGSDGGHNGLKSIIDSLNSNSFARLRIGISPQHPIDTTRDFVLSEFNKQERPHLEEILIEGAKAINAILRNGIDKAMCEFNATDVTATS